MKEISSREYDGLEEYLLWWETHQLSMPKDLWGWQGLLFSLVFQFIPITQFILEWQHRGIAGALPMKARNAPAMTP